jgi:hypothetical protein
MTPQLDSERMAQLEARGIAIRTQPEALFFELGRAVALQIPG